MQVEVLFFQVEEVFGLVDILVNNVGINCDVMLYKLMEVDWDMVIDVNLKGIFFCMQQVVICMCECGVGCIINIVFVSWFGNVG